MSSLLKRLRFADPVELGILKNRVTLKAWIDQRGFPPGQMTGPNTRTWAAADVEAWLASRPTNTKSVRLEHAHASNRRKAAARKAATAQVTG